MGIHVSVYKQVPYGNSFLDNVDCTAGGESSYSKGFTIVNAEGPFEPCSDYPAAELIMEEPIGGRKCLRVVTLSKKGKWTMFGGNYAATSDSRFSKLCDQLIDGHFYGAVAVFDRVEF
jgi:hypothetical protein